MDDKSLRALRLFCEEQKGPAGFLLDFERPLFQQEGDFRGRHFEDRVKHQTGPSSSLRSRYFCGSALLPDLSLPAFFSYHRHDLKSSFTSAEKQALRADVSRQMNSNSSLTVSTSPPFTTATRAHPPHNIDWTRIESVRNKSPMSCLMMYRNECDPSINTKKWSPSEEKDLLKAVEKHKERNWCEIADAIQRIDGQHRTPMQCLHHYQLNLNKSMICPYEWTPEEEQVLQNAVQLYGTNKAWNHVANCLEGRAKNQCYSRWKKIKSKNSKSGTWNDEEERKLVYAVVAYENGQNSFEHEYSISDNSSYDASFWQKVSTCVEQRDEVRCREKWTNVLDPLVINSTQFTSQEDEILLEQASMYEEKGVPIGWSKIAKSIGGRTDSQCLRRWKELSGSNKSKSYVEKSKKRRAVTVPRHSRHKASRSSLDETNYSPVLISTRQL